MALYFFSGKGGVGKTHLASSLAYHLSRGGRKVLLVEFSKFAQYSEYFASDIGFDPVEFKKDFFVSSWTGLDCLFEYTEKALRSKKAAKFFLKIPLMKKLIEVAPGLKEISVLGKMTSDYRDNKFSTDFEDIIFDCPASGHFLSMLSVPESLKAIVGMGPMKRECESIQKVLRQHKEVHYILIEDSGELSKIELKETELELKKIIGSRSVNILKNGSDKFPHIKKDYWTDSAEELSSFWAGYKWI